MSINANGSYSNLTGAQQTMMSWARVVDSIQDIPEMYRVLYKTLVGSSGFLPRTVLAPSQGHPRKSKPTEKILCEVGDTFYVLQSAGNQVAATGFYYHDIHSLEVGNILLYSWFSIHGRTISGANTELRVEFNEATLRHFSPFFRKMRPKSPDPDPGNLKIEQGKFDYLINEDFKLMNFACESLLEGERVIQSIYQARHRQSKITALAQKHLDPIPLAPLMILTDQEVILLRDAENISEKNRSKYGGVRRFLPLHSIVSAQLKKLPNNLLEFTILISPETRVKKLFDSGLSEEVECLKTGLETLLG
jgi:hypothetical protein